ncbi:MAG: ATP-binding cassette domain-containing protein [Proteobacteria bacterium]|nr:ATP-binding cassette domain-containing protein [Pseudomonadota bacterium]
MTIQDSEKQVEMIEDNGNSEVILEVRDISKRFGKVQALDAVSLIFRKGEIHTLLGENGAGKTTLMNIIYGLYHMDSGEILLRGRREEVKSPNDSLRLGIGMVPQFFKLVPDMTIVENIFLFMKNTQFFFSRGQVRKQIRQLSEAFGFGLEESLDVEIADLSEGGKQKVEILKVLARESEILLFDEATNVLAPNELQAFLDVIKDMNRKGYTILYITHRLQEALSISDRISVFRKGKLIGTVTGQEATVDTVTKMMVGREIERKSAIQSGRREKPLIRVENLNVLDDRGLPAVRNVSFELYEGEIVGLAGIEGNGSDQLAEAIMGLRPLQGGRVTYKNADITSLSPIKRVEMGMSFIPSLNTLVPLFNVRDNTILDYPGIEPFSKKGILNRGAITDHATKIVETYEVQTPSIFLQAAKLSGGNRQRLALGRKIEANPELIIAYHPTKGLDIKSQNFIYERFLEMEEKGTTILFMGTDLDEILQLSNRLMVIYRGEIVGTFEDTAQVSKFDVGLLMTGGQTYFEEGAD